MHLLPVFRSAICLGALLCGTAAAAQDRADEVRMLAENYVEAEFGFDQQALKRLIAPEFVEVSPKGEVDEHDAVLSFYAPDKKVESPAYTLSEVKVRLSGDVAFVTQVIGYAAGPRTLRMTQGLSAIHTKNGWKLVSSQTTPIPAAPPKAP